MKQTIMIFLIFFFITLLTPTHSLNIPKRLPIIKTSKDETMNVQTFFYKQTLDHFNYLPESYTTFNQRYMIDFKYWGGANSNAPILVELGAESPIDDCPSGFLFDNGAAFKALLVCIEHRYYGKSVPFRAKRIKNATTFWYFHLRQALADYAEVIIHIKKTLQAQNSPVVVIGGSYGGMLATWFRLKYPHIAMAALASSAPILSFDNITPSTAYFDAISKIFKGIDKASFGNNIIDKIYSGLVAFNGNATCRLRKTKDFFVEWEWQVCTEIIMPHSFGNHSMFRPQPYNFSSKAEWCKNEYGVSPRPHWITTYYGGYNIKMVLRKFASNIIFSNGLKDPFSYGGVLSNLSDSLVAVVTVNGTHCLDTLSAIDSDPGWLVEQRKKEVEIIQGWISQYYNDLD